MRPSSAELSEFSTEFCVQQRHFQLAPRMWNVLFCVWNVLFRVTVRHRLLMVFNFLVNAKKARHRWVWCRTRSRRSKSCCCKGQKVRWDHLQRKSRSYHLKFCVQQRHSQFAPRINSITARGQLRTVVAIWSKSEHPFAVQRNSTEFSTEFGQEFSTEFSTYYAFWP
jgi:hypothetical protein